MPLKLMYITNRSEIAQIAESAGVDRIFVDMEYIGKSVRQGGMDTVQSHHTLDDVKKIADAIETAELLVRVNPIHEATEDYLSSQDEIRVAIDNGAKIIMLPYFKTVKEVEQLVRFVDGRAKVMPLIETPEAVEVMDDLLKVDGVDEWFIGLNDLSLGYGKHFMFELLTDFLCQKRYVTDHLSHKQVKNDQKVIPSYYVRDHHTPIISRRQFERVHKIMDLKNRNMGPAQYPYDDKLVCPVCGRRMIQRRMQVVECRNTWICERDAKSCGMYALGADFILKATLEAYASVDMAEVEEKLNSVRKAQRETAQMLIDMKRKHRRLKKVDFYWVDDLIDRITFGEEQTMTIHWKCGVKTSVRLDIRHRRENPIYIAEVYQRRKKEGTLPKATVLPRQPEKNINLIELSKNA